MRAGKYFPPTFNLSSQCQGCPVLPGASEDPFGSLSDSGAEGDALLGGGGGGAGGGSFAGRQEVRGFPNPDPQS